MNDMNGSGGRPELIAITGGLFSLIGVPVFILGDILTADALRPVGIGLLMSAVLCFTAAASQR